MFLLRVLTKGLLGTRRIIFNIIVVMGILVAVSLIGQHAGITRTIIADLVNKPSMKVLGVKVIDIKEPVQNPTERIKKDLQDQVDVVKKQSMNIKVSDVLDTASRVQKVVHDMQAIQRYFHEQMSEIMNKITLK